MLQIQYKSLKNISITLNSLGEIRMGCDAYGIIIKTDYGTIDIFKDEHILVGHTDYSKCIEHSKCKKYLLVKGDFATYIIDIKKQSIALYKITIHDENIWSEERAIFGKEKKHINGFLGHYYLQFPFIKKDNFLKTVNQYKILRKQQIKDMLEQSY